MELFALTHAIPANTSPEEVINLITMNPNATDHEKFLVQHFDEALGEVALKEDEVYAKECEIEQLEGDKNGLEDKVAKLGARLTTSTQAISSNTSLAEIMRAILMDPNATTREKFLVKYFEAHGGTWGWHQNFGQ